MLNAQLRLTKPVWSEEVADGGMFPTRLAVHEDPDGGPYPFLAVAAAGMGGGCQGRRATLDAAKAHTAVLHRKLHG